MSAVERAAGVIGDPFVTFIAGDGKPGTRGKTAAEIAQALADAGLLITDIDKAVIDAAERDWNDGTKESRRALHVAVSARLSSHVLRARRETQS